MKFGIHNPLWVYGPDPAEAFEAVKAKAQWAEDHGFVWFSVMDHLIQIGVGAPDEPFIEGWMPGAYPRRRAGRSSRRRSKPASISSTPRTAIRSATARKSSAARSRTSRAATRAPIGFDVYLACPRRRARRSGTARRHRDGYPTIDRVAAPEGAPSGSVLFLGRPSRWPYLPATPWHFVLLLIGGLGTAAFSKMETTLLLTEAPLATRSRVMGIVTMCIGTGPVVW